MIRLRDNPHCDQGATSGIGDRIRHQISQKFGQQDRVGSHFGGVGAFKSKVNALRQCCRHHFRDQILCRGDKIDGCQCRRPGAGIDPGQDQKMGQHPLRALKRGEGAVLAQIAGDED